MTITLTLPPEKHVELERRAAAVGTDVKSFILDAVQEKLDDQIASSAELVPYDEWRAEFRTWVAGQRSRNPRFDDSRESIYE